MVLCHNCGESLLDKVKFCSKCGALQKGVDCPITSSGMIYLFANQFVKKTGFIYGERVPCTDKKVHYFEKDIMLVAAAFIWLEENGWINLQLEKEGYRLLGFLSKRLRYNVHVTPRIKGLFSHIPSGSLEKAIWNTIGISFTIDDVNNLLQLTMLIIFYN